MAKKNPKRVPDKRELVAKVHATEEAQARAVAKIERELKKLYEDYFARVQALVSSDKELRKSDAMSLQSATKVIGQLEGILIDAGFGDVVRDYGQQFEPLAAKALEYYEPFGLDSSLAGLSRESLTAYVEFSQSELAASISARLVAPIQSALLQANFGSMTRDQVIDQVLALQPSMTPNNATVLVDDAFSQFQRTVVNQRADALDLQIYLYIGPDDAITSDQCQAMLHINRHGVPGMLYRDEIDTSLHPKLRRNPLVGGGHPRCRHHWSPVSDSYAESQGFEFRRTAA